MTDDYKNNYEQMQKLNHELDEITAGIMDVGDRQREITKKRNKMIPRERIDSIIDPGTAFLEIG